MYVRILKSDRRRYIEYKCDQCNKIYIRGYFKQHINSNRLTFCSINCSNNSKKSGGSINLKFKKTCIEKYGSEYALCSDIIKKKIQRTCLSKYGVDSVFKSDEIKKKIKKSLIEHYSVENPSQSDEIKEKKRQTCIEHYSVENPSQSDEIKEKKKQSYIQHYGVEYLLQSDEIKEKVKQTCLKKFGVDNPFKSKEIRLRFNQQAICQKRHETMKHNGSYRKSKIEDEFYKFLCEKFGEENIERQIKVHNWNIDFYVESIKTYIQFDGIYWHGLDRNVECIKESLSSRDKVILETRNRDTQQNEWFEKNKLSLIRITDKEFKNRFDCQRQSNMKV